MTALLGKYKVQEVEERTGVPATTLRQWERRYSFPNPERAPSGYRLYSDNDLHYIKLMRRHITEGVSASRAAELVKTMMARQDHPRSLKVLYQELLESLLELDESKANEILSEAYNLHPVEAVMFEVMQPCMVTLGDMWHRQEITVATEHFASSYIAGRLRALLNIAGSSLDAACVIISCAPEEYHELGPLMLAVMLRRVGYQVYYLGANMPLADLVIFSRDVKADVVMVSASTVETFTNLAEQKAFFHNINALLAFGGWIFNENPQLAEELGGVYLGPNAKKIANALTAQLQQRVHEHPNELSRTTQRIMEQISQGTAQTSRNVQALKAGGSQATSERGKSSSGNRGGKS